MTLFSSEKHLLLISAGGDALAEALADHTLPWRFRTTRLGGTLQDGLPVAVDELMADVAVLYQADPFMGVVIDLPSFEVTAGVGGQLMAGGPGSGFYLARQTVATLMSLGAGRTGMVLLGRGSLEGDVPQQLTSAMLALDVPHPEASELRDLLGVYGEPHGQVGRYGPQVDLAALSLEAVMYSLSGWASGLMMSGSRVNMIMLPEESVSWSAEADPASAVLPGPMQAVAELVGVFVHPVTRLLNGQVMVADGGQAVFEEQLSLLGNGAMAMSVAGDALN